MGAVRIIKIGFDDEYPWAVRSGGCPKIDANDCEFGTNHEGYCNDYANYTAVLRDLNTTYPSSLGGYITK